MTVQDAQRAAILAAALKKIYPAVPAAMVAKKLAAQKIASNQGNKLNNG